MPANYHALANVYDQVGFATFAETMTPRLVNYAQQNDWAGRTVLDLGCGTGVSLLWFGKHAYAVTGVDTSVEMLHITDARLKAQHINAQLFQQDIRQLQLDNSYDLALALDVLNSLDSLRDLEAVFRNVAQVLPPEKLFVFDLYTLEGLAQHPTDTMTYNDPQLTVFTHTRYDYERQVLSGRHLVYQETGGAWTRLDADYVLRGYPLQAIASLLMRTGFDGVAVLNTALQPFTMGASGVERVLVFARRAATG